MPEKETSSDHGGQEASLVVKWRAPIDHPTSDWIGTRHLVSALRPVLFRRCKGAACILGADVQSAAAEL